MKAIPEAIVVNVLPLYNVPTIQDGNHPDFLLSLPTSEVSSEIQGEVERKIESPVDSVVPIYDDPTDPMITLTILERLEPANWLLGKMKDEEMEPLYKQLNQ
jgi:hypothetical protein